MQNPAEVRERPPFVVRRAHGVHIEDERGRQLLDATSGGLSNVTLGYSAEPIREAINRQLGILPYFSAFRGHTNEPAEQLAHALIDGWFGADGMSRVFFTSGGSDSVETALRLARQYWKLKGQSQKYKFIALRNAYHGTHFGGGSLSSRITIRNNYEPLLPGCFHIPTPCTYRNPFDEADPARLSALCLRALDAEIEFQGPGTVAAFIAEPVSAAGGLVVPPADFWPGVRRLCDKHDILLIADEVITGFGRTGHDSGARLWGVKPDLMCVAKGITSGYFPLGATMVAEPVSAVFEAASGPEAVIAHGYTYSGHPVGCAAGLATLALARELGVVEAARSNGELLLAELAGLAEKHACIGDLRGKGLMACLEIVGDRATKQAADVALMDRIAQRIDAQDLVVRVNGTQLLITPALTFTAAQVRDIVQRLDAALGGL